jgi:predicted nucleotidyltransferase
MDIIEFGKKHAIAWDDLFKARELTAKKLNDVKSKLSASSLASSDVDVVVFGSVARDECTLKSDADWTLLVDGQANSGHLDIAHIVESAFVAAGLAKPGKTGMFGQITFSHDLIHYIGGEDDTNHNLSRRILLLLESKKIVLEGSGSADLTAYNRVLRGVIQQYVDNDSGLFAKTKKQNVPRFLLNDIIRFWRTMCVDFAFKQREQQGEKWALRNIKLRMARKLIFVKGLLMCYLSHKEVFDAPAIVQNLVTNAEVTPLEFLVKVFVQEGISDSYIAEILDSYNEYLKMLDDEELRTYLEELRMEKAYGDVKFEAARSNSHRFQEVLNKVFLYERSQLQEFTLKYGVF